MALRRCGGQYKRGRNGLQQRSLTDSPPDKPTACACVPHRRKILYGVAADVSVSLDIQASTFTGRFSIAGTLLKLLPEPPLRKTVAPKKISIQKLSITCGGPCHSEMLSAISFPVNFFARSYWYLEFSRWVLEARKKELVHPVRTTSCRVCEIPYHPTPG